MYISGVVNPEIIKSQYFIAMYCGGLEEEALHWLDSVKSVAQYLR